MPCDNVPRPPNGIVGLGIKNEMALMTLASGIACYLTGGISTAISGIFSTVLGISSVWGTFVSQYSLEVAQCSRKAADEAERASRLKMIEAINIQNREAASHNRFVRNAAAAGVFVVAAAVALYATKEFCPAVTGNYFSYGSCYASKALMGISVVAFLGFGRRVLQQAISRG